MKKVTIKKGHHYSFNWPRFYWNKDVLEFTAVFTDSCLYNIPGDDGFISKLTGLSFGMHHKNSFRIGWRHDSGFIILYAYWYTLGVRLSLDLFSIEFSTYRRVDFKISFDRLFNQIYINGYCGEEQISICNKVLYFDFYNAPRWGYGLNFYFGGQLTAPQTISVYLDIK